MNKRWLENVPFIVAESYDNDHVMSGDDSKVLSFAMGFYSLEVQPFSTFYSDLKLPYVTNVSLIM